MHLAGPAGHASIRPVQTPPEPSAQCALRPFRVRVKAKGGPRTRTLTLGALSAAEAESLAASELDDTWQILAVEAVQ